MKVNNFNFAVTTNFKSIINSIKTGDIFPVYALCLGICAVYYGAMVAIILFAGKKKA